MHYFVKFSICKKNTFKSYERGEYSFIGSDNFFQEVLNLFRLKFIFTWFFDFFQFQFLSFVERKAYSTIGQQKCQGHEKRDQLLVSKVDLSFQISQRNKILLIVPVFSNSFNLFHKFPIKNYSRSLKGFKGIYFFL